MGRLSTPLLLHNREVRTVFDLVGERENDITFSIGWALSCSRGFRQRLLNVLFGSGSDGGSYEIRLQDHGKDGGYTDIEFRTADAHLIIEAKRGWTLPSKRQLLKYSRRLRSRLDRALLVMSSCTATYAKSVGALTSVNGVPVRYMSWEQVQRLGSTCCGTGNQCSRLFMGQLCSYLEQIMELQDQESNLVYVVALSTEQRWPWSLLTPAEFVTTKRRYFHPYGRSGWPTTPPNYLGFRYGGQLQSIHHVQKCGLVNDLSAHLPEVIKKTWRNMRQRGGSHMLYSLGPPIVPPHVVKTGNVYMNARVTAAIDLLLTCRTIAEARDRTIKRIAP